MNSADGRPPSFIYIPHANSPLQRFADNPHERNRHFARFDLDEPPTWVSSSEEDEEEVFARLGWISTPGSVTDEFMSFYEPLMRQPLSSSEVDMILLEDLPKGLYDPGHIYALEQREEERALLFMYHRSYLTYPRVYDYLGGPAGRERRSVIARRNIRCRWEKMGLWNTVWGIPGREDEQHSDDPAEWLWKWHEQSVPEETWSGKGLVVNPNHPNKRVLEQRRHLSRNELLPIEPREPLPQDGSAPQATGEDYITSRPWYVYFLDVADEEARFRRMPKKQRKRCHHDPDERTIERWKSAGMWREDWRVYEKVFTIGWRWPHESPISEPKPVTEENVMDLDFTPSEADALEAIEVTRNRKVRESEVEPRLAELASFQPMVYETSSSSCSSTPPAGRSRPAQIHAHGAFKPMVYQTSSSSSSPTPVAETARSPVNHTPSKQRSSSRSSPFAAAGADTAFGEAPTSPPMRQGRTRQSGPFSSHSPAQPPTQPSKASAAAAPTSSPTTDVPKRALRPRPGRTHGIRKPITTRGGSASATNKKPRHAREDTSISSVLAKPELEDPQSGHRRRSSRQAAAQMNGDTSTAAKRVMGRPSKTSQPEKEPAKRHEQSLSPKRTAIVEPETSKPITKRQKVTTRNTAPQAKDDSASAQPPTAARRRSGRAKEVTSASDDRSTEAGLAENAPGARNKAAKRKEPKPVNKGEVAATVWTGRLRARGNMKAGASAPSRSGPA